MNLRPFAAKIHFNSQGTPVADDFDDVYFSNDSGIDETQHVFINGNDLHDTWQQTQQERFVIGETGFGTGLNCLVVMQAFHQFRQQHPDHPLRYLHLITTEKFPMQRQDIAQALAVFPSLSEYTDAYLAQYPVPLAGCHRLQFPQYHTTLDIWIGDIKDSMPQWHCPATGLVDAWFLDGFAPSKNPEMWSETLFSQLARLSKANATFATFTAAGMVKRGLKDAGFTIEKRKGFGRKRDMLAGRYTSEITAKVSAPPYYRFAKTGLSSGAKVAVIGAGLAGISAAQALANKGMRIVVIDSAETPATGASGNDQGGFYPQLHADASQPAMIQAHSFLYAERYYQAILNNVGDYHHDFCGVALVTFNDNQQARHQNLLEKQQWPEALVKGIAQAELEEKAGVPLPYSALWVEKGGWINPPSLIDTTINNLITQHGCETHWQTAVSHITHNDDGTMSLWASDALITTVDHVVIATGHHAATQSWFEQIPLRPVRGQVERVKSAGTLEALNTVLCHKGYLTPSFNGYHALGSTYVKGDVDTTPREEESRQNLDTQAKALAECDWITQLTHDNTARASIRLGTPDHQPIVGLIPNWEQQKTLFEGLSVGKPLSSMPLPDNESKISYLTGLGSRGLTTAPLMAEVLASELTHSPMPMSEPLLQALAPNRYLVRDLIRNKV